ncbi:DUF3883 domain-containing protein [Pedobacter psychroterrae]|uniref:DUF3883 domain-containing protein n=1 Tax=Pedobacter psychroterrae TaxID=2530453 RepID=A0A4R0NMS3_9SPHI|nr:DUF3883 domain-containing protein [Pedobacter psychroterrae]TCD01218.1 DUF3883 domain-containing protein [Pedobacter psychroterrae]
MFAIIAENDVSKWNDETGVKYHFPNKYKRILTPGTKVIYYKGGVKHYFGYAVISDVYQDEENNKNYYAEIIDYLPFYSPIKFKDAKGEHYEDVIKLNHWRDGVRVINEERFNKIIEISGLLVGIGVLNEPSIIDTTFPQLEEVNINLTNNSLITTAKPKDKKQSAGNLSPRYSKESTKIGNQGEKIVIAHLERTLSKIEVETIRHHALENEKYGYDISYVNLAKQTIYLEVKATTAALFNNFLITINELNAARQFGANFKIYLVNNVTSKDVKIEIIENLAELLETKQFSSTPMSFKIAKMA